MFTFKFRPKNGVKGVFRTSIFQQFSIEIILLFDQLQHPVKSVSNTHEMIKKFVERRKIVSYQKQILIAPISCSTLIIFETPLSTAAVMRMTTNFDTVTANGMEKAVEAAKSNVFSVLAFFQEFVMCLLHFIFLFSSFEKLFIFLAS